MTEVSREVAVNEEGSVARARLGNDVRVLAGDHGTRELVYSALHDVIGLLLLQEKLDVEDLGAQRDSREHDDVLKHVLVALLSNAFECGALEGVTVNLRHPHHPHIHHLHPSHHLLAS